MGILKVSTIQGDCSHRAKTLSYNGCAQPDLVVSGERESLRVRDWLIEFYEDEAGKSPVKSWLDSLSDIKREATIAAIQISRKRLNKWKGRS